MRKGITTLENGVLHYDLQRIVGHGFNNGWFTNCHCRYRVFEGARNTGKSKRIIGYESLCKIMSDPRRNIVIARQDAVNNKQSVYANVIRCIADLGLESYFKTQLEPLQITYIPTGQLIIFRGLNNPTSWTSLEFVTGNLTDIYVDEAYEIPSFEAFEVIDGSVRAGSDYDEEGNLITNDIPLQITLLLNPWSKNWIYEKFFHGRLEDDYEYLLTHKYMEYKNEEEQFGHGKGIYLHKSTFRVNEFRNINEVDSAAEFMKQNDPDMFKIVFLGMWGATGGVTYPEFGDKNIRPIDELLNYRLTAFTIGIDAGFSNGEGKKRIVKKGEDATTRVRSATTMSLSGITFGFEKILVFDEFYHTNIQSRVYLNTDSQSQLTMPEIAGLIIQKIIYWRDIKYKSNKGILLKGKIEAYVDNADVGFLQTLQIKAREYELYNVDFIPSTKSPINGRVLFEKTMMSYAALQVNSECKNLIREFKNARGDEKGNIRTDEDDHMITCFEYGIAPYRNSFAVWKNNFKDQ